LPSVLSRLKDECYVNDDDAALAFEFAGSMMAIAAKADFRIDHQGDRQCAWPTASEQDFRVFS
jgi:hypothetical protein